MNKPNQGEITKISSFRMAEKQCVRQHPPTREMEQGRSCLGKGGRRRRRRVELWRSGRSGKKGGGRKGEGLRVHLDR